MNSLFDLTGRVAVVAGGTSGLGQSIARALASHGATVAAAGRRSADYPVDVSSRASIDHLKHRVLEAHGRVDILVYAAGITANRPTLEVTEDEWRSILDTNTTGALRACQSFYEPLKASGRGRIILIASLSSYVAFQRVSAYCASKSALLSLTRSLAVEWARGGINVNAIAPGVFPTELNRSLVSGTPRGAELLARIPMARFGNADELSGAALLLASSGASYMTGQCIVVDGGFLSSGVNC